MAEQKKKPSSGSSKSGGKKPAANQKKYNFDRGEIILANAIRSILKTEGAYAYEFQGIRYDIGDKFGFLQANVEYALRSPFGDKVKTYLKDLSAKL